jgi:hypothetical protein
LHTFSRYQSWSSLGKPGQVGSGSKTSSASTAPDQGKNKKSSQRYIKTEKSDSTSVSTQNLKGSAPQQKTCLPGEGKDREKDPCSRPGSCCLVGCMWIVACDGRRWPASVLQASSGLFGEIGTLRFNSLAESARLE